MDWILNESMVILRQVEEKDMPLLHQLINDPRTERSAVGWNLPVSYATQLKWFYEVFPKENSIRMMIDLIDNSTIGMISLTDIDEDSRSGALSIKILRQFQGKRHTADALIMFGDYCYKQKGINCIYGYFLSSNNASRRLMRMLEAEEEGIQRSAVYKDGKRHDLVHFSFDLTKRGNLE